MNKLKPELVEKIKSLCMNGSNVMLNSNMMLNMLAYVDHLEKLASLVQGGVVSAAEVKQIEERVERASLAAAIINTSPAQKTLVQKGPVGFALERRGPEGFAPAVPGVVVMPMGNLFDGEVSAAQRLRYTLDTDQHCILVTWEDGSVFAKHYISAEEEARILNADRTVQYSMGCKLEPSA